MDISPDVLPNGYGIQARGTDDTIYEILSMDPNNIVVLTHPAGSSQLRLYNSGLMGLTWAGGLEYTFTNTEFDVKGNQITNFVYPHRLTSANITNAITNYIISVDTSARHTITLATVTTNVGRVFIIKDVTGNANVANIIIDTEGGQNIDGAASYTINTAYGSATLYSNGSNWFVIGET